MINAASRYIGLMLLIATAVTGLSQKTPVGVAVDEVIRREHETKLLRLKLAEANEAAARRDLTAAARLYSEANTSVEKIGSVKGIETETEQVRQGLVAVHLELARIAAARGNLQEVQAHTDRVLVVDPKNPVALQMRADNAKLMAVTYAPTANTITTVQENATNRHAAKVMARNAGVYLQSGMLLEAERELKEAARLAPDDEAVMYYQNILTEKKFQAATRRAEMDSRNAVVQVEEAWNKPTTRDLLPVPNAWATNNLVHTGSGRQAIMAKLDRIRVDTLPWSDTGLGSVIGDLSNMARKRDINGKGINIILNPNSDIPVIAGPPVIDPNTGLPVPAPVAEAVDISTIGITLNPLEDIRLADALDAIVKVAKTPIKYSIEDYAIFISLRGPENPVLYIRTFRVDPNTFYQGLEGVSAQAVADIQTTGGGGGGGGGGGSGQQQPLTVARVNVAGGATGGQGGGGGNQNGGLRNITVTNSMAGVSIAVQQYFTALGVDLASPAAQAAGKSVFWNDRAGQLLVRATAQDLDMIEAAIQLLNKVPHQVNIRTKFVEVNQEDNRAFGVDWYIGNFFVGGKDIIGTGGTAPSYNGAPSAANPLGTFPGVNYINPPTTLPPAASDGLLTGGLRNEAGAPALATFTGILTDPQFRIVIRALDQRKGIDLLASPEVTTVSGRQAQVQVVDQQFIVTGQDQNTGQQNQAPVTTGGGGTVNQAAAPVFQTPQTTLMPFGPTLDVIPYISADGYTVQMTLIPAITEFVGYDDPGPFVPTAITGGGLTSTAVLPLPHFRLRQVTTSAVVWDGQTMVLGGLLASDVTRFKDKVPILGDLPFVGKAFRSESTKIRKKNLLIFVTPTILDPAGNRLHTDEEMPFAANTIPPQPVGGSSGR